MPKTKGFQPRKFTQELKQMGVQPIVLPAWERNGPTGLAIQSEVGEQWEYRGNLAGVVERFDVGSKQRVSVAIAHVTVMSHKYEMLFNVIDGKRFMPYGDPKDKQVRPSAGYRLVGSAPEGDIAT